MKRKLFASLLISVLLLTTSCESVAYGVKKRTIVRKNLATEERNRGRE